MPSEGAPAAQAVPLDGLLFDEMLLDEMLYDRRSLEAVVGIRRREANLDTLRHVGRVGEPASHHIARHRRHRIARHRYHDSASTPSDGQNGGGSSIQID